MKWSMNTIYFRRMIFLKNIRHFWSTLFWRMRPYVYISITHPYLNTCSIPIFKFRGWNKKFHRVMIKSLNLKYRKWKFQKQSIFSSFWWRHYLNYRKEKTGYKIWNQELWIRNQQFLIPVNSYKKMRKN